MLIEQQILELIHNFNNDFLDLVAVLCHFLNDKGMVCILVSIVMIIVPKTRKMGIVAFATLFITAITTEVLKEFVSRERPFSAMEINNVVNLFNTDVLIDEDPFKSFPSGHVSSVSALVMSIFLMLKKKNYYIFIIPLIMMWSRMYLFVHYPSDVFSGMLIGFLVAILINIAPKKKRIL